MKKIWFFLALPLAVGGLATLLSGGMDTYSTFIQPPLSPPGWVFPVVWTILYLLMGYASYRVAVSDAPKEEKKGAGVLYGAQLFFNFLWPLVFFGLEWRLTAFFILVVLWILIYLTIRSFSRLDERGGDLLLPYLIWVTFAGYLNLGVALLN